ncbi:hypothetical protein PACTADRAFT_34761 [Pachysolen tannophilus NRRL Y-2460]|uniref:Flavodoxin-like domain-containing protein n=1 Tax=Pachysolen tannophilus NRRL Y-2460 TaxID=669874 RepID=A0A1E4TTE6_PACTA|nr:hypothetical protein PACTADRAFT_34761 [Pachysolen tannophilus NRRL Y-2460]
MSKQVSIAIIYYSGMGHTKKVAEHVYKGVLSVPNVTARLFTSDEAIKEIATLENFDGFIFGSPTYMGNVAAKFKEFMEATSPVYFRQRNLQDKIAAGFTNSASFSGDKQSTLLSIFTFAAQHGMIWVPLGLPPLNNNSQSTGNEPNRCGFFTGLGTQSNADQSAEFAPPETDLLTAESLGARVAKITHKFNN